MLILIGRGLDLREAKKEALDWKKQREAEKRKSEGKRNAGSEYERKLRKAESERADRKRGCEGNGRQRKKDSGSRLV